MAYALPGTGGGVSVTINNTTSSSGSSSAANQLTLPFAFGDASPAVIGNAPASKQILSVQLFITTAFNGSSPALQVGIAGTAEDLMAASENTPGAIGEYTVYTVKSYGSIQELILTITPGAGASAGAGVVVVTYES